MNFDLSLYLVVDPQFCCHQDWLAVVMAAIDNGVTMVQYRDKSTVQALLMRRARQLKAVCAQKNIPLIINDHVDLALAIEADGVHLGQQDMSIEAARMHLGPDKILGLSIENTAQLKEIRRDITDYLGFGPVFTTPSKSDAAPAMGLDILTECASRSMLPSVAIGGINHQNALAILATGVSGLAVVSSICSQENPGLAAKNLSTQIYQFRGALTHDNHH